MSSTNVPSYSLELSTAFAAADRAKSVLMHHYGRLRSVDEKLNEGLVSEADRESEVVIREEILRVFPDHQILGEEGGLKSGGKSSALWIVDPVDGTTNYVHQLPFFCISIGLKINDELVVGVIDAPVLQWRFHAVRGGGAFLNGERIQASDRRTIREGLFATGFAYHYQDNELDRQFRVLREIVTKARGVRRAGSAALDLCMVASGIFDGYWEGTLKPWDMAAGVLIAQEAGAVVTNYRGDEHRLEMPDILASNRHVHRELVALLKG